MEISSEPTNNDSAVILSLVIDGLRSNPNSDKWHEYFGQYVQLDIEERKKLGQLSYFEKFVSSMENFGLPFIMKVGSIMKNVMTKHLHDCSCKRCQVQKENTRSDVGL